MLRIPFRATCLCLFAAASLSPAISRAAGGTMNIATKGQPAHVAPGWPDGVGQIVNDPARTEGWNSWFSEWPNDVNQYAFEIKSTGDLNRLIEKLAAVKSEVRQIYLSPLKEPRLLGWVTGLPEGNNTPVIFSIGDQSRIDEWYGWVRKPFGKIEFVSAPVAVAPTLTIFVQNSAVDLDRIAIPAGITVTRGEIPTLFHRWNTAAEKKSDPKADQEALRKKLDDSLDPPAKKAAERIHEFLKKRTSQLAAASPR